MTDAPSDSAWPAGTLPPQAGREYTTMETARAVAMVIVRAAQKIGASEKIGVGRPHSMALSDLCTEIVLVSPLDGRITEIEYGMAWWLLQPPGTPLPF
jgi:hypothetical protein